MSFLRLSGFYTGIALVIFSLYGCQTTTGRNTAAPSAQPPSEGASPLAELTSSDTERLHKIIKDYILANPSVITQALQISRIRQQTRSLQSAAELLRSRHKELYDDELSLTNGVEDPDVTIVEFFDYRCGFCKKAHPVIKTLLAADPKIKFIYKEYPILGQVSHVATRAALAAHKQGKYLEFHNKIFSTAGRVTEQRIMQDAASIGLDINQLKKDMLDSDISEHVARNKDLARGLKISGTPTFIIGNQIIHGFANLDKMKQAVSTARKIDKYVAKKN